MLKNLNVDVKYVVTIIIACCVLHNFYNVIVMIDNLMSPRDYIDVMPTDNDRYPETKYR